uniref:ORF9 protein n=1 Tax=Fowl adenovirus A serotype 1 (strain CELO / Phelps) TaxID=10553 RepID=Q64781_ADEG1|nr:ORF9 [Fowl aviadenovirus 1]
MIRVFSRRYWKSKQSNSQVKYYAKRRNEKRLESVNTPLLVIYKPSGAVPRRTLPQSSYTLTREPIID